MVRAPQYRVLANNRIEHHISHPAEGELEPEWELSKRGKTGPFTDNVQGLASVTP